MPAKVKKKGKKYEVKTPGGVKAKGTTKEKAEKQKNLLNAIEHNPDFKPRKGKKPTPRQFGGPVMPGKSYMVGEAGPETFIPDKPGTIKANKGSKKKSTKPGAKVKGLKTPRKRKPKNEESIGV